MHHVKGFTKVMIIICCIISTGKETTSEDPYGSLWLDSEEPVKIKRRRRSSLLVVVPKVANVFQDNIGDTVGTNEASKVADSQTVSSQNINESKYAVVGLDNILAEHEKYLGKSVTEENENFLDKLDRKETVHNQVISASIINSKTDNETGVDFNLMAPQIDEGVPKKSQHLSDNETLLVCTPPDMLDEHNVTGPQSMSPEFPVSPSDLIYLRHHDDSYINYLPADHRGQQHCEISDAAFTTNSENISTQSSEFGALIVEAETDVINNVELSVNATRLQTSPSYTANAEYPFSDKENNNLAQEDNSSNSPGFLSLCKAFAGKVVDLVKTSPSYLSKILQDSKSNNAESPSVKQNSKSMATDHIDKSYSDVKVALASELDRSLENVVEDSGQIVKVYSVTGIAKPDEASEKVGKIEIDQINDTEEIKQEIVSKCNFDAFATGRKQKRQKSSQVFFDTFNAVSSELNKSVLLDEIDKCEEAALMENTSKITHSQANANIEKMLPEMVGLDEDDSVLAYEDIDQAVQTRKKQVNVENGNGLSGMEYKVETDTADLNSAFKETHNLPCDKQQSLKLGKRRKVDEVKNEKLGQNKHKSSVIIERKRRKSSLSGSFTEMGDHTKYNEKIVSSLQCEQETILSRSGEGPGNSTCSLFATADPTDNTASVVEDFSKLELLSLPQPVKPIKERVNLKKDRKRRRSNNFYFPSVYNDSEGTLDDMKGYIEQSKQSDFVDETSRAINTNSFACTHSKDREAQVNAVATEISLVSIKDPDTVEKIQTDFVSIGRKSHKAQTLKTALAPEKKFNNETLATRHDVDKETMTDNSAEVVTLSSAERKGNGIDSLVPQADEEPAPGRKRRRSADAAALKIQLCAGDIDISQEEQKTGPTTPVRQNRKRKKSPEIPLEDIYKNKNYKKPQDKTWETIFESPKVGDQLFSKRRVHTTIDFEKPTQAKLKRRSQKAVKNGWDSKKRKRKVLAEETFQMKISDVFTDLDKIEDESISDKIKQTLAY